MLIFLSDGLKGRLQDSSNFTRVASERETKKQLNKLIW